jgi:threonine dehydrogenase-like Zn-dependent dehydrogenase
MDMPRKRRVAAVCGDGRIRLVEQDVPALAPGTVLVEVHASLVSPGTELGGWAALAAKRSAPDPDPDPRPFGYANAGVVLAVGEGVRSVAPGQRVGCMGAGYALHTDFAVIPHNLCLPLPDDASFTQGAYAHLAATALQTLRRGAPEFGERVAVVGLGLVGQLTAQLYRLAGNYVIGWDTIAYRREVARRWGIDAVAPNGTADAVELTRRFTEGYGLDAGVLALGGDATEVYRDLESCLKLSPDGHRMGRVIVVGGCSITIPSDTTNVDIRRASRTGPGYHDETWEHGEDYPPVFMRWTTRTNLQLCLRLMAEGRLDVDALTTHRLPFATVTAGVERLLAEPDSALGVVFVMA